MTDQNQTTATDTEANTPSGTPQGPAQRAADGQAALSTGQASSLLGSDMDKLRSLWSDIQVGFVDNPRESVEKADALVARVMQEVTTRFAAEQSKLKGGWSQGDSMSTEDLRLTLQRYRAFFDRLLSLESL